MTNVLDASRMVVIQNNLVRAPQYLAMSDAERSHRAPLTVLQLKLIRQILSVLDQNSAPPLIFQCTLKEFLRYAGMSSSYYKNVRTVIAEMTSIQTFYVERDSVKIINWIKSAEYTHGSDGLTISLNEEVLPYVTSLKAQYTAYCIGDILCLPNYPSIRLYEYIVSYASLIQKANNQGNYYVFKLQDIRTMLGYENKYSATKDFIRVISGAIEAINCKTELKIEYLIEKIQREYCFKLKIEQTHTPEVVVLDMASSSETDPAIKSLREKYIAALSTYYTAVVNKPVGKKLLKKLTECFEKRIRAEIVRQAFAYTARQKQSGKIEKSVEAYARKMIDLYAYESLPLDSENLQTFPYDVPQLIAVDLFGSDDAAALAQQQLMDDTIHFKQLDVTGVEFYVTAVRWFAETQLGIERMDYSFYNETLRCFQEKIDIRVIFQALYCTYRQSKQHENEQFNFYAYTTSIIRTLLAEGHVKFDPMISKMTLDWCCNNM